ncbi:MarR family transcriptional regulator [Gemmatimonas aurantiaca]|uniref:GbsR/MarR family transcriptional regulator n=1 Tax=Gemmatimonas aurantiaca TaxID=173480 RepID=UPI00301B875B
MHARHATDHPAIQDFLDHFSAMMEPEGLPRPAGRMLGVFFVEGGPLTAEELAERLQISRSNVSTTVRILESLGVVHRTRLPGERTDRFRLHDDPFVPMLQASVVRATRMRDLVQGCRTALPATLKPAAQRLLPLERFFGYAANWLAEMAGAWPGARRPR